MMLKDRLFDLRMRTSTKCVLDTREEYLIDCLMSVQEYKRSRNQLLDTRVKIIQPIT